MTLYQQEMLRKLGRLDCAGRYDEEKGLLVISSGGTGLCCQDKKGYLSWESEKIRTEEEKAVLYQIGEQAKLIRAYVGQYENSPSMGIPEVEGYRRMAECGDTVMAGMYSEQHGFMFTTWTQNGDRSRVTNGDYSPNYEYVKEAFAIRAGLVDRCRLFTPEEAASLYRCVDFTRNNCMTLTWEQEQELNALTEKLQFGYPQLEEAPPSFEQGDNLQLNM